MTKLANRVISIHERKTSMRLAKPEWTILDSICLREKIKRRQLLELIDAYKDPEFGLTPAVRLFSLLYLYNTTKQNLWPIRKDSKLLENILNEIAR